MYKFVFAIAVMGLGLATVLAVPTLFQYSDFGGNVDSDIGFSSQDIQENPVQAMTNLALGNTGVEWLDTFLILPLQIVATLIGVAILLGVAN